MARHDRILVSPTRGNLVEELLAAQGRANEEVGVLAPLDYFKWESLVRQMGERPEGRQQWSDTRHGDTARVAIAWWTDHLGRRHFRVVGGNSRDGSCRNLSSTRTDHRPPLWHVYPERLFCRDPGDGGEWIAVCGCGEAGPPRTLGWMGRRCAVCHDRDIEGETAPRHVPAPVFGQHVGGSRAVVFSPDGSLLASVRGPNVDLARVRLEEVAGDEWQDLPVRPGNTGCLAFSPDGGLLAGAESHGRRLLVYDVDGGEVVLEHEENFMIGCLAFAPDGLTLAAGGAQGLHLWERQGRAGSWQLAHAVDGPVQALAWSPDGEWVALAGPARVTLLGMSDGRPTALAAILPADHFSEDVAFTEGGKGLVCLSRTGNRLWWQPGARGGTMQHCDLSVPSMPRETASVHLDGLYHGRLSGDGRWLAWAERGESMVRLRRAMAEKDVGRVCWDVDVRPAGLEFSPDGETIATVGEEGTIKLIPWRLLLGEPGAK